MMCFRCVVCNRLKPSAQLSFLKNDDTGRGEHRCKTDACAPAPQPAPTPVTTITGRFTMNPPLQNIPMPRKFAFVTRMEDYLKEHSV